MRMYATIPMAYRQALRAHLEGLATELLLPAFDLLLVGDGSGTTLVKPSGWYCVSYERSLGEGGVQEHFGGAGGGTNNYAELLPYCFALWAYHVSKQVPTSVKSASPVRVAVVSDSEVTVRCGNGEYERRANACLWAQVEWFERNGYDFRWVHVPRNSNPLNERADAVAGLARSAMASVLLS
jgi:ribonuclease HI